MKRNVIAILFLLSFITYAQPADKFLPTSLKVTIVDESGNPVDGATVILYASKDDYLNSTNAIQQVTSNKKGIVKFKKLDPQAYYIEASKDGKKNDGLGAMTDTLQEGKINKVSVELQ
jgi:hypothetical protein